MRVDGLFQETFPAEYLNSGTESYILLNKWILIKYLKSSIKELVVHSSWKVIYINGNYVTSVLSQFMTVRNTLESVPSNTSVPDDFIISNDRTSSIRDYRELANGKSLNATQSFLMNTQKSKNGWLRRE